MKKTLSRIAALLLIFALTLALCACGGPSTVEEYLADPAVKADVEDMLASLADDETGIRIFAEGNTLVCEYTILSDLGVEITDDVKSVIAEQMDALFDENRAVFDDLADSLNEEIGITDTVIRLDYFYHDGTELYSYSTK